MSDGTAGGKRKDRLRWQEVKALFEAAVDLDLIERSRWLAVQCGDDQALLLQVQALLKCDGRSSEFLKSPLNAYDMSQDAFDGSARLGQRVGAYTLNRVIGSGGMGTVYEATQEQPRRTVAVKVMRAGIVSRSALRRFEHESQWLGRLRHPGIAQVYEAGTCRDGETAVPFFAMEYIVGAKPVTDYAATKNLNTRERAKLIANVCEAVHHGHQKGIIHRDLKPGNILVDASGQVKIIDFGVARSTDSDLAVTTMQTDMGQLIGTLAYMSPEQCAADRYDIDTRSDVYSLGVVFYEVLCGRLPYPIRGTAILEATRAICEQEPTKLSAHNRMLRGDVETIALKALEKDRDRRYQSASAYSSDIKRYLNYEAITARPPSTIYQLGVFARRNKSLFLAMTLVFLVLIVGVIVSTAQYQKANAARLDATRRAEDLKLVTEFQQSMLGDVDAEKMGRRILEELRTGIRNGPVGTETDAPAEVETRLAALDRMIGAVNLTNLALTVIDKNVLTRAVETIDRQFANQPLVRASLQQTIADTYREIGLFDRATPLQEACLQTRRRQLGNDHLDTLVSINSKGLLLQGMGKYEEAQSYVREAMESSRRVLGDDHPNTLNTISNLGHILKDLSKYEEALLYAREALEGQRRVLGEDHLETLRSINDIGLYLRAMGEYAQAEPYLRDSMERKRRVLGSNHLESLISIDNMGHVLKDLGKYEEALVYLREALEGKRRILGDNHPSTLVSINNVGHVLKDLGQYEEALPYLQEVLDGDRRILGDDHPSTAISIHNMGQLMRDLGRLDEAESLGADAVNRARRTLPKGHSYTGIFLEAYGKTLLQLRRFADAEAALLESHLILVAALGSKHDRTIKTMKSLIDLYESWAAAEQDQGFSDKAINLREELLK